MSTHPMFDITSLLNGQADSNPKLKMLMELMQRNTSQEDPAKVKGQLSRLMAINRTLSTRYRQQQIHMKKVLKYLNFLIDVNTVFSSAVGACECWGEDSGCTHCQGKGRPGYFQVNERAFREYVMPCMEQVREESREAPRREKADIHSIS